MKLELRVNGETVVRDVPAEELLLDFLRERLDLTGAKRSCDVQVCGACTVLLDGQPVSACCTLAVQADGCEVTTIEGLAAEPEFALLEDAFMRHAALQCGFCTRRDAADGVVAARGRRADERRGRAPCAGRQPLPLHRLQGHRRGRRASSRGCRRHERGHGGRDAAAGRSLRAAARRAREAARPGPVRGRPRRAAHAARQGAAQPAAARAHRLDRHSRAEAMPGVVCVLTARDLGDIDPYWGHAIRDRPILAIDRVRFHGEPIAAVAAEDEATAERALLEIASSTRSCRSRARSTRRSRPGRRSCTRGRCARASSTASASSRRATATLLSLPHRARRGRGGLRPRRHRRRGRVRVPGRLPVRDGDAHGDRPGRGGRGHALGQLPAPVPRAGRDRRALRPARSRRCA